MSTELRVIKLGGSLLDWTELVPSFRRWLSQQPEAVNIVVVGGGPLVEALRKLDRRHQFPSETVHWLAIRLMDLGAQLVAELLDDAVLVRDLDQLQMVDVSQLQILQVLRCIGREQATCGALPVGWHITSDSIAACVANKLGAVELVLLKSALPSVAAAREACAASGYVDAYFPRAAGSLAVRCVNLRSDDFAEVMLE